MAQGQDRGVAERLAQRRALLPVPTFPEELPVSQRRDEIARAIADHQVVIVCGETGSGKTTQLPKICLSLGRGVAGMIGHTQPRRIAARTLSARIAQELRVETGAAVGYKIRFSDHVGDNTYIKVMTDGILLAEMQHDKLLRQYDTLIIDEAHERSLNIDFILGCLKQLLPRRPDLKLIITSATIDPERFSRHFNAAPIIEVSGRTYPVEMRYRPLTRDEEDESDRDMQQAILEAVDELFRAGRGDVLVFLSGEREIRETAEALRKHHPEDTEILPLYARLSVEEQNRVFQAHGKPRIVLATNVAETSLTVPGIRYVIDTGHARVSRYSHRSKVQRLPIEKISQASADQRAGRCGRVGPGVCIRLYEQSDYLLRPRYTDPEIMRTNLSAVILQMLSTHIGEPETFPFIDPPDSRMIKDGYQTLIELGALDQERRLTSIGRQLARLPVDPRIGRMILAAKEEQCLHEVLIIASGLAVQDPRERPMDRQQAADGKHRAYADERSDFLSYLKLWQVYHEQARHLSNSKLRKYCQEYFLSYMRLHDWCDIHSQLTALVHEMGMRINQVPATYEAIHRALLTGLLGNIAFKGEDHEYIGARNAKMVIFPGSGLARKGPKWLIAAELVETARLYVRIVAGIEPEWVERLAPHLIKRHYFEPHWEKKQAAVMAYERVTLYGLPIVPKRKIHYGRIQPAESRDIFIRAALVAGDYETRAPFFEHNRALVDEIEQLEHKARRQDILVDEQVIYEFYEARVSPGIYDGRSFDQWRKEAERKNPKLLFLSKEDLIRQDAFAAMEQFPDHIAVNHMRLALHYHFEPGHAEDGVTVTVPISILNQLRPERFEWMVPGLLREKMIAMIKSLPKSLRRNFVPVPNFADACLQAVTPGTGSLLDTLEGHLKKITGVAIPREAWAVEALPAHLRMNFRIVDEQGKQIAMDRDLLQLQCKRGDLAQQTFASQPGTPWERDCVTQWDFGDLPEQVSVEKAGLKIPGYPALRDDETSVSLRLLDTQDHARKATRLGLRRLFMLQLASQVKYLEKNLPGLQPMCMHYAAVGSCDELKKDLINAVFDRVFAGEVDEVRTQVEFNQRLEAGRSQLASVANELCSVVGKILAEYHAVVKLLKVMNSPAWLKSVADIKTQLDRLVYPGFVTETPADWLPHMPRYLKAVVRRLDKLKLDPGRDAQAMAPLAALWQAYAQRVEGLRKQGREDPRLDKFRWMLEELRVSLFAQELKTIAPVSVQRLEKLLSEIRL